MSKIKYTGAFPTVKQARMNAKKFHGGRARNAFAGASLLGLFATASIYGIDYSKDITERRIAGRSEVSQVKEHNLGSGFFVFLTCVFGVSAVGTGVYGANQLGKSIDHAKGRRDEDLGMHVQDTHNLVYYDKR